MFVGPFRDPSLVEIFASARGDHTADELLAVIDHELERVRSEPIRDDEIRRAQARLEFGLLAGLSTVDGKASTIGFYDTLLGRPAAAFERLRDMSRVEEAGHSIGYPVIRIRYLAATQRTVVMVRSSMAKAPAPPRSLS